MKKITTSLQTIGLICICLMLIQSLFVVSYVQAQGPVTRPPPGSGGGGSGGSSSGGGSSSSSSGNSSGDEATVPGAMVSGFVYNYSSASYEGGVKVVVDDESWQLETLTDSNGYYQIGNLGTGPGVINLHLPSGTQSVMVDWPLQLAGDENLKVDLGYYWGDDPPIPVILSSNLTDNQLAIQIENRTPVTATGGMLSIVPPIHLKVSPPTQLSQGQITSFDPHYYQINIGEIKPDDQATYSFLLQNTEIPVQANAVDSNVSVTFTYDQQVTPQKLALNLNNMLQPVAFDSSQETQESMSGQAVTQASAETTQEQAQTDSNTQPTSADESPASSQDSARATSEESAQPVGEVELPVTGTSINTINTVKLSLAILLVLGLGLGGWQALRIKR